MHYIIQYAHGMSKGLVYKKQDIKCNSITEQCKND